MIFPRFDDHLRALSQMDRKFHYYVCVHWLKHTRYLAYHAQSRMVHSSNTTNNRVENAHGRLKRRIKKSNQSLEVAMHTIWAYAHQLVRDFETQAVQRCDRPQLNMEDVYVDNICRR